MADKARATAEIVGHFWYSQRTKDWEFATDIQSERYRSFRVSIPVPDVVLIEPSQTLPVPAANVQEVDDVVRN